MIAAIPVSWPPRHPALLVLGLVVATYWARVLRMVLKARRRSGRGMASANFVPPEAKGRWLRIAWAPAVAVWLVHPVFTCYVENPPAAARPVHTMAAVQWAASGVAAVALGLTWLCWRRMRRARAWRMGIDPRERTALVVDGPWAVVAHPIYALSSLMMWATMVALPSGLMVAAGLVHLVLLQWEARREEAHLTSLHGQGYTTYQQAVGRFVPRLRACKRWQGWKEHSG